MVGSRLLIEQLAGPNIEGWDCTSLSSSLVHEHDIHPLNRFHECFIHRHIDMNSPVSSIEQFRENHNWDDDPQNFHILMAHQSTKQWLKWLNPYQSLLKSWLVIWVLWNLRIHKPQKNHQLSGCLLRPRPAERFRAGTRGWDVPRLRWGWVQVRIETTNDEDWEIHGSGDFSHEIGTVGSSATRLGWFRSRKFRAFRWDWVGFPRVEWGFPAAWNTQASALQYEDQHWQRHWNQRHRQFDQDAAQHQAE